MIKDKMHNTATGQSISPLQVQYVTVTKLSKAAACIPIQINQRWILAWQIALTRVKFGVEEPNVSLLHSTFHLHWCRGGVWDPKTANFAKLRNTKPSSWCIPRLILRKIHGGFMFLIC